MRRETLARVFASIIGMIAGVGVLHAELTIEECVRRAREHYPLIRQFKILENMRDIDISDIDKGWLPKVGVYAQGSGQNAVPEYPGALSDMLTQMGQDVRGLSKLQYKVGVDLNQQIWDGGRSAVSREMAHNREEVGRAGLEVELYAVKERVENIYFAMLIMQVRIEQNAITARLLEANLEKLRALKKNGVARQADCDLMEARLLATSQEGMTLQGDYRGLEAMLLTYIGGLKESESLVVPDASYVDQCYYSSLDNRPEGKLLYKRETAAMLSEKLTDTSMMPKIGFFAQAYYGYPGLDYFRSMMKRDPSFNVMAGVRISWNLDGFYTRNNLRRKTYLEYDNINTDMRVLEFNIQNAYYQELGVVNGIQQAMQEDDRIVELLHNVRLMAEAQLTIGVIDMTDLLAKISEEETAAINAKTRKIRYQQELYKIKHLLGK